MARPYEDEAELYDIAFDWEISDEADWVVERLRATAVPEPGCGSGRMLEALADRGCRVVGIDTAPQMVALARARRRTRAEIFEADMSNFDLGRTFDGAVCPINSSSISLQGSSPAISTAWCSISSRAPRFSCRSAWSRVTRSRSRARTGRPRGETACSVSAPGSRCSPDLAPVRCSRKSMQ